MKKLLTILVFAFSLIIRTSVAQTFENVDAIKFKSLVDAGDGIVLDVRTPNEFANGHIPGSTHINIADPNFNTKINLIQKDKPIYVYCLTGSRSAYAAKIMVQSGFKKVYNLQRGIREWMSNGYPVEKSEGAVASNSVKYTEENLNEILKKNKVVLIDYYAQWCAPCKKMSPDMDKLTENYKGKVEIVKVDIEANDALAKSAKVISVPTLLIYKSGKQVWRNEGYLNYDAVEKELKKWL